MTCEAVNCHKFHNNFGDTAICEEVKDCLVEENCSGVNLMINPKCCPQQICDPKCVNEEEDCDVTPPP